METVSSPVSNTSSAATAPSSVSRQPTYTTAGTIYNPSSSQPLLPPARRGRSFKWSAGAAHPDLALLPKAALEGLPLKVTGISRSPSFHLYSPLQQNYDRAVSPNRALGQNQEEAFEMSAPSSNLREGNSLPEGHVSSSAESRVDELNPSDSEDKAETEEEGLDLTRGMPVKSLQNLASYPNPNQKAARRALCLGAKLNKTDLASHGVSSSTSAPGAVPAPSADCSPSRCFTPNPRSEAGSNRISNLPTAIKRPTSSAAGGSYSHAVSSNTTLATGPGVPRPLTAGPPGQRQYRPSTFDSTFKALQGYSLSHAIEEDETLLLARQTVMQAGIENLACVSDSFSEVTNWPGCASPVPFVVSNADSYAGLGSGTVWPHEKMIATGQPVREMEDYIDRTPFTGLPASLRNTVVHEHKPFCHDMERFQPGTTRLSEAAIEARNERIDRLWYEGSDLLGKCSDDIAGHAFQKKTTTSLGVIGDGRPKKGKPEHTPISIDEANRMPTSDHAKPLLNMALASLERYSAKYHDQEILRETSISQPGRVRIVGAKTNPTKEEFAGSSGSAAYQDVSQSSGTTSHVRSSYIN
ncbi:hypothetical protein S7711_00558 [Stachybotrys chartarum IBT 7711]|uniref:Uncharacterized protein n=1 Tax=Stachybotrys chartarum (strain CBS 109288 / IBT 7711) TaxID=1280523 RepID=A0A084ATQ5_STACB|nr:hypothetical protein S7711_00558 [Stachybotrys chartarum IBT 7711]